MAVVTGDRYLDLLARFVEENLGFLLEGGRVLKLNPVGLHYVQTRLEALEELERLLSTAPVDYLRAYVADLGDHRALELLRRVLKLLGAVKVVSVLQAPARDPTPINLLPFERLRSLELRGCDLSTTTARGLLELRPVLERLVCHNSADALRHIFAEPIIDIADAPVWTRLTSVSCACNNMLRMDESLQLLPVVEVLDLSRNRLSHVANLKKCLRLKFLDLTFNRLQNLSALNLASVTITTLLLSNNALSSVSGIERLYLLETLDLSRNIISSLTELEKLANMSFLHLLFLEGNPISFSSNYRVQTISLFPDPSKLLLDGKHMTRRESWVVSCIAAKKNENMSVYGLYTPAKRNASVDSNQFPSTTSPTTSELFAEKAKRKNVRVAAIREEGEAHLLGITEHAVEPLIGLHASSLPNNSFDQVMNNTGDSNLQGGSLEKFMNQVERLKREGSNSWLQELNKFLELDSYSTRFSGFFNSDLLGRRDHRSRRLSQRKKKVQGKMLSTVGDSESGRNFDDGDINFKESLDALKVLEDLVDAKLSSSSVASPPHFNDDLLQRRQDLEEELSLLRADSRVFSSSDSETSSEMSSVPIYDSSTSTAEYGPKWEPNSVGSKELGQSSCMNGRRQATEEFTGKANALLNGDEGYFLTPGWIGSDACEWKVEMKSGEPDTSLGNVEPCEGKVEMKSGETDTSLGNVEPVNSEHVATISEVDLPQTFGNGSNSSSNLGLLKSKVGRRVRRVVLLEEIEEVNPSVVDLEENMCIVSLFGEEVNKENRKATHSDTQF